ncbi:MAG: DUF4282 domain-containing protein [Candidatus Kaistia colombiensis]|nr:MAG: DUF4282 domain-containing protein [Kaistia sp.]
MTSFLDLFKWDRFVATSVIELLFWLLATIAVLFGISGLLNGLALVQLAPVNALLAIAASIIGTLAAIVAARVVCEAVIMLFRVNESLMDIRDGLANAAERAPFVIAEAPVLDPLAAMVEDMLPEPPRPAASGRVENRWGETRPPEPRAEHRVSEPRAVEPKSSETSSLEARLAEIRARREATAARIAATTAPSDSPDAGLASARMHLEEAAAPKWVAPPVAADTGDEASLAGGDASPSHAEFKAPEVKAPEPRRGEGRKTDARKAVNPPGPAVVKAVEEAQVDLTDAAKDAAAGPAGALATAVAEVPAGEADAPQGGTASEAQKATDAA